MEEDVRILEHNHFNYYMTMTYMYMMYRGGLIYKDEYELCHDKIGEKNGFKRDGAIWWSAPPTDGKRVDFPPKQHSKNRTYTKHNNEYWSKLKKVIPRSKKTTLQEYFTLTWSFFSLSRLKKVGLNSLILQILKFNPLTETFYYSYKVNNKAILNFSVAVTACKPPFAKQNCSPAWISCATPS